MRWLVRLAAFQGAFFALTGLWALVHLPSFEAVTGPKTDDWLVKTVGILVLAVGFVMLVAALRLRVTFEVALLCVSTALALAVIDIVYVANGTIRWVYLLDAAVELALVAAWSLALWRARDEPALWGRENAEPVGGRRRLGRRAA